MDRKRIPRALKIIAAVVLVAGLLGAGKILTSSLGAPKRGESSVPVALATVKPAVFTDRTEALGTAHSNESVTMTAKVTETVRRIAFTDGQLVNAGDVLIELTNEEESASLQSAPTALSEAQRTYDRVSNLQTTGFTSHSQLDTARTARDNAKSRVDTVVAQLSDRLIRAPFTGMLGFRSVSPGSLVRPGDVITTLDDVSVMKLDFVVPEAYLGALHTGLEIEAKSAAYPDRVFKGTIEAIDSRVDPVTRAVTMRAVVPNPDNTLRPGMLMTLDVIRNSRSSPAVPERAIVALSDQLFVYKVEGGKAVRAPVTTGEHQNGFVEIASGLKGGERIVIDGVHRLRPGQKVEIVESDGAPVKPPAAGAKS